jgi:hypothetical protein
VNDEHRLAGRTASQMALVSAHAAHRERLMVGEERTEFESRSWDLVSGVESGVDLGVMCRLC